MKTVLLPMPTENYQNYRSIKPLELDSQEDSKQSSQKPSMWLEEQDENGSLLCSITEESYDLESDDS